MVEGAVGAAAGAIWEISVPVAQFVMNLKLF